jgi:hypothetical protein
LIMLSLKLSAMAVGARPMKAMPIAAMTMALKVGALKVGAVPVLWAQWLDRRGKPDGLGMGMAPLGEGTGFGLLNFPPHGRWPAHHQNLAYLHPPPRSSPRQTGSTGGR